MYGPPRFRVPQYSRMVDERRRPFIRGPMQLDEQPLDIKQVPLERIEEPPGLEVLRRGADGKSVLFDDIANPVPVRRYWAESEKPEGGVAAVGCREYGRIEELPAWVGEYRRHLVRNWPWHWVVRRGVEVASGLELAAEEAVERIEVSASG